jgi:hypothetical protein
VVDGGVAHNSLANIINFLQGEQNRNGWRNPLTQYRVFRKCVYPTRLTNVWRAPLKCKIGKLRVQAYMGCEFIWKLARRFDISFNITRCPQTQQFSAWLKSFEERSRTHAKQTRRRKHKTRELGGEGELPFITVTTVIIIIIT